MTSITSILHPLYYVVVPQSATITSRAHGIDISKYDVTFDPNLTDKQLDFVFQRISYGVTQDEQFHTLWRGVRKMPIRMAYHYLSSHINWKTQADAFLSYVKDYEYHAFACDFEGAYNDLTTGFARSAYDWLVYVEQKTGKPVILYTSLSLYNSYIAPSEAIYNIDWDRFAYWQAQWFLTPNPNGTPTMPTRRTGGWQFWQYTDKGSGYGTGRNYPTDLDVFNGTPDQLRAFLRLKVEPPPLNDDLITYPFDGVMQIYGERFGCKVRINIIDPEKVKFEVRNEDGYPSQICRKYGAQIAWNGDDWYRDTRKVKDNDSPSLMIFPDRTISMGNWRTTAGEEYHTSGLRWLIDSGINQIPVNGTEDKYIERHARSIMGLTRSGDLFHMTVDGDWPDKGMLLYECAQVGIEFDCLTAFDQGGGGDTVEVLHGIVVNVPDDDIGGIHYERKVPQTILVYAKEINMINGTAKEKLGNTGTIRKTPSRYGEKTGGYVKPFSTIEFVEIVDVQIQGTADRTGEKWLKLPDGNFINYKLFSGSNLVDYFTILTMPGMPDPEPQPNEKKYTVVIDLEGYKPVTHTGILEPE